MCHNRVSCAPHMRKLMMLCYSCYVWSFSQNSRTRKKDLGVMRVGGRFDDDGAGQGADEADGPAKADPIPTRAIASTSHSVVHFLVPPFLALLLLQFHCILFTVHALNHSVPPSFALQPPIQWPTQSRDPNPSRLSPRRTQSILFPAAIA